MTPTEHLRRRTKPLAALAGAAGTVGGLASLAATGWVVLLLLDGPADGELLLITGIVGAFGLLGSVWFIGLFVHGLRLPRDPLARLRAFRVWLLAGLALLAVGSVTFAVALGPAVPSGFDLEGEFDPVTGEWRPREPSAAEQVFNGILTSSCCGCWAPFPVVMLVLSLRVRSLAEAGADEGQGGVSST